MFWWEDEKNCRFQQVEWFTTPAFPHGLVFALYFALPLFFAWLLSRRSSMSTGRKVEADEIPV